MLGIQPWASIEKARLAQARIIGQIDDSTDNEADATTALTGAALAVFTMSADAGHKMPPPDLPSLSQISAPNPDPSDWRAPADPGDVTPPTDPSENLEPASSRAAPSRAWSVLGYGLAGAAVVGLLLLVVKAWQSPEFWDQTAAPMAGIAAGVIAGGVVAAKTETGCLGFCVVGILVLLVVGAGLQAINPNVPTCPPGYIREWIQGEVRCFSPELREESRELEDLVDQLGQ